MQVSYLYVWICMLVYIYFHNNKTLTVRMVLSHQLHHLLPPLHLRVTVCSLLGLSRPSLLHRPQIQVVNR